MTQQAVGEISIERIVESICTDFDPLSLFPGTTAEDWARHRNWMEPHALDPVSGNLVLTIQAFLVRTRHHTILVDTCVGDHKSRPHRPFWHLQQFNTFLPRLAAAGVEPEDVDYVMCTHLHGDHVGWNTQLRDGRWVPTFPKAKYVFARSEWEVGRHCTAHPAAAAHRQRLSDHGSAPGPTREHRLCARRRSLAGAHPGHTLGHVNVRLASQGAPGGVTGDCIHSPVQCVEPAGSCARTPIPLSQERPGGVSWNGTATAVWWCVRRISPNLLL